MNLIQFAEKVLKAEKRPLTALEIWEIGYQKGYVKQLKSYGKTPWSSIGARIYVELRDKDDTVFVKMDTKPVTFYVKNLSQKNDISKPQKEEKNNYLERENLYHERDLHKFLTYYVFTYNSIYTKTIFHESSSKKKFSQWLHPDIVGVFYPFEQWEPEIREISNDLGTLSIKLFSFELKRELNLSNLRESYF
jgi:hypothetical protein